MVYSRILCCFVAKSVFLRFTLFCCKIGFVAIYALSRGEKLCLWRKNDKGMLDCKMLSQIVGAGSSGHINLWISLKVLLERHCPEV